MGFHPALDEREEHLTRLNVAADACCESAWSLFDNTEQWQQQLTVKVYQQAELPADVQTLDNTAFENRFRADIALRSLPAVYNGFYDNRKISELDVNRLSDEVGKGYATEAFDNLFITANAGLYNKISAAETDIEVLKAIAEKQINAKSFDFDGNKYNRQEAAVIQEKLQEELNMLQQQQEALDERAYRYFYHKALQEDAGKALQLKSAYLDFFKWRKNRKNFWRKPIIWWEC